MNQDDDDLIGFKDFLTNDGDSKKKITKKRNDQSFELLTFLQNDSKRITKKINLYEEKAYMLKNFPQSEKLVEMQYQKNFDLKLRLLRKLKKDRSPLMDSMDELFDYFLSKK